ncbi:hypothetical protein [uncultured Draconibacterium sp.]|uniref:hypothetical protein n=1 Tax=uncultured Draconibacterium sp. TaxID=1573823 RepID=UPI0032612AC9
MKNFMLVLLVLLFCSCGMSPGPEKVLETYYKNLFAGKMIENIDLMAGEDGMTIADVPGYNPKESAQQMKEISEMLIEAYKTEYGVKEVVIDKFEVLDVEYNEEKDRAKVSFTIQLKDVERVEVSEHILINIDKNWKVSVTETTF